MVKTSNTVILSAAKDLLFAKARFFASLRMTTCVLLVLLAACGSSDNDDPARAPGGSSGGSRLPPPATTNRNIETPYCELAPAPKIGIAEVARRHLSERTLELDLQSAAMQKLEQVLVTLPRDYDASGRKRYPVLYLLHGSLDDHTAYFNHALEDILGELPLIVVSPDAGPLNSYSDWYGSVLGSGQLPAAAETYILDELLPYIENQFPVRGDRAGRAVAGLSMGGAGTMKFAAARPHLFAAAGSFSGALNTTREYPYYPLVNTGTSALSVPLGPLTYCTWGDFIAQHVIWKDNDPTYLAENLRGVAIWLSCGGGQAEQVPLINTARDPVEIEVCEMTEQFMQALDSLGIPHTDSFYDNGTHAWEHWMRELGLYLTWQSEQLAAPQPQPEAFDYRSARAQFTAWGWELRAWRDAREFIYLSKVTPEGFTVSGSGVLDVITPPLYRPKRNYIVAAEAATQTVRADDAGRLAFRLDLGPSHAPQQMEFGPDASAQWTRLDVSITPEE